MQRIYDYRWSRPPVVGDAFEPLPGRIGNFNRDGPIMYVPDDTIDGPSADAARVWYVLTRQDRVIQLRTIFENYDHKGLVSRVPSWFTNHNQIKLPLVEKKENAKVQTRRKGDGLLEPRLEDVRFDILASQKELAEPVVSTEVFGLGKSTMAGWRNQGRADIPFNQPGGKKGRVFYRTADLVIWLAARGITLEAQKRLAMVTNVGEVRSSDINALNKRMDDFATQIKNEIKKLSGGQK